MSLFKRQARRVAGVGVGVALLVLGLEAPAFAAPVATAISPTSGPVGCVVAITGTGFDQPGDFAVATVKFTGGTINSVSALFHVVSDTEIWTTVPTKPVGGTVQFNPVATATASHTGAAESPTTLVVNVPPTAKTGPIKVTTWGTTTLTGGTVTSTGSFTVVTDPALCAGAVPFARSISLRLRDALVARGKV